MSAGQPPSRTTRNNLDAAPRCAGVSRLKDNERQLRNGVAVAAPPLDAGHALAQSKHTTPVTTVTEPISMLRHCIQYLFAHPETYGTNLRAIMDREITNVMRLKASEMSFANTQPVSISCGESVKLPYLLSCAEGQAVAVSQLPLSTGPSTSGNEHYLFAGRASGGKDPAGQSSQRLTRSRLPQHTVQVQRPHCPREAARLQPGAPPVTRRHVSPPRSEDAGALGYGAMSFVSSTPPFMKFLADQATQEIRVPHDQLQAAMAQADHVPHAGGVNSSPTQNQPFLLADKSALPVGHDPAASQRGGEAVTATSHREEEDYWRYGTAREATASIVVDGGSYEVSFLRGQMQQLEAAHNAKCVRLHELTEENAELRKEIDTHQETIAEWERNYAAAQRELQSIRNELYLWKDRAQGMMTLTQRGASAGARSVASANRRGESPDAFRVLAAQLHDARTEIDRLSQLWRETERTLQNTRISYENTEKEAIQSHNHLSDAFHYIERLERRVARRDAFIELQYRRYISFGEKYDKLMWCFNELDTLAGSSSYVDWLLYEDPVWTYFVFVRMSRQVGYIRAHARAATPLPALTAATSHKIVSHRGSNHNSNNNSNNTGVDEATEWSPAPPPQSIHFTTGAHGLVYVSPSYEMTLIYAAMCDEVRGRTAACLQTRARSGPASSVSSHNNSSSSSTGSHVMAMISRAHTHTTAGRSLYGTRGEIHTLAEEDALASQQALRWWGLFAIDFLAQGAHRDRDGLTLTPYTLPLLTLASLLLPAMGVGRTGGGGAGAGGAMFEHAGVSSATNMHLLLDGGVRGKESEASVATSGPRAGRGWPSTTPLSRDDTARTRGGALPDDVDESLLYEDIEEVQEWTKLAEFMPSVANSGQYDQSSLRFILRCFWRARLREYTRNMQHRAYYAALAQRLMNTSRDKGRRKDDSSNGHALRDTLSGIIHISNNNDDGEDSDKTNKDCSQTLRHSSRHSSSKVIRGSYMAGDTNHDVIDSDDSNDEGEDEDEDEDDVYDEELYADSKAYDHFHDDNDDDECERADENALGTSTNGVSRTQKRLDRLIRQQRRTLPCPHTFLAALIHFLRRFLLRQPTHSGVDMNASCAYDEMDVEVGDEDGADQHAPGAMRLSVRGCRASLSHGLPDEGHVLFARVTEHRIAPDAHNGMRKNGGNETSSGDAAAVAVAATGALYTKREIFTQRGSAVGPASDEAVDSLGAAVTPVRSETESQDSPGTKNTPEEDRLEHNLHELLCALYYYAHELHDSDADFRLLFLVAHQRVPEVVGVNFYASLAAIQADCEDACRRHLFGRVLSAYEDAAAPADKDTKKDNNNNKNKKSKKNDDVTPLDTLRAAVAVIDRAELAGGEVIIEPDSGDDESTTAAAAAAPGNSDGYRSVLPGALLTQMRDGARRMTSVPGVVSRRWSAQEGPLPPHLTDSVMQSSTVS